LGLRHINKPLPEMVLAGQEEPQFLTLERTSTQ
jgi:hypothetical protein